MKKVLIIVTLLIGKFGVAQSIYLDPTTTAAIFTYAQTLKNQQKETRKEIKLLKEAKAKLGIAMLEVDRVQKKVHKGLMEVSGTVKNGMQVKEILWHIEFIKRNSEVIAEIAYNHPQYSVFAVEASKKTKEKAVEMGMKVTETLTSGESNLMTAGDRYDLLQQIYEDVRMLGVYVYTIRMHLERAKMVGFWKSINPFQGYINTDKNIVENIINQYKILNKILTY